MFAEKQKTVMPPLRLHSEVTDFLSRARTPLDVLTALAREGAAYNLDVWAMAIRYEQRRMVYLCSVAPLEPSVASGQLAHFQASSEVSGDCSGAASEAEQVYTTAVCLRPDIAPAPHELAEYRDLAVRLKAGDTATIRAAALRHEHGLQPNWSRATAMVQYAAPYLRALDLRDTGTTVGMIDAESETYSWPYFIDALTREVERSLRGNDELALAVLELRPLGEQRELPPEVHKRIGEHLTLAVRRTDVVGRTGPSSYAVCFHNTSPRPALIAAGRIVEALKGDRKVMEALSFSVGVSGWEGDGPLGATSLLAQATEAAAEARVMAPDRAFVYL